MKIVNTTELKKPYISVEGSFGGNQRWLRKGQDKASTLSDYGCGLISANDVILHISDRTANTSKERYIAAIRKLNRRYFHILPWLGLSGLMLSLYMKIFLLIHRKSLGKSFKVRWAVLPHNILSRIREMLSGDIPVILSIGPGIIRGRKEKLTFYAATPDKSSNGDDISFSPATSTKDHYVNVTGIYETEDGVIYLEISSWGKRYYVNFDEYMTFIKKHDNFLFSNILYIKPR